MMTKWIVPIAISGFWFVIGFILPCFVPRGPNKGITQVMLMVTAVCCYVLWLTTFIAQLNPLFGPQVNNATLSMMYRYSF